jgi:hypothetical protein
MPKTVQIRGIDDAVYAGLVRRAAEEGITVPGILRRAAARIGRRPVSVSTADVLATLDEWRGESPGLGRSSTSAG